MNTTVAILMLAGVCLANLWLLTRVLDSLFEWHVQNAGATARPLSDSDPFLYHPSLKPGDAYVFDGVWWMPVEVPDDAWNDSKTTTS